MGQHPRRRRRARPGGRRASSTRSTRAASRTRTATGSATSRASRPGSTTWRALGVDAVWLSPFYPSPMADFGYDVADYCDVDPLFGTLADFDRARSPRRTRAACGCISTSSRTTPPTEHPWFVGVPRRPRRAERDWYIWRDPRPGGAPPNNWLSTSADRPGLRRADRPVLPPPVPARAARPQLAQPGRAGGHARRLRFWLDRGVDGFRLDVTGAHQGPAAARQPAAAPATSSRRSRPRPLAAPPRPDHPDHAPRVPRLRRSSTSTATAAGAHRRALPLDRRLMALLRRRARRAAPALQLRPARRCPGRRRRCAG